VQGNNSFEKGGLTDRCGCHAWLAAQIREGKIKAIPEGSRSPIADCVAGLRASELAPEVKELLNSHLKTAQEIALPVGDSRMKSLARVCIWHDLDQEPVCFWHGTTDPAIRAQLKPPSSTGALSAAIKIALGAALLLWVVIGGAINLRDRRLDGRDLGPTDRFYWRSYQETRKQLQNERGKSSRFLEGRDPRLMEPARRTAVMRLIEERDQIVGRFLSGKYSPEQAEEAERAARSCEALLSGKEIEIEQILSDHERKEL
jgi:hypothetical protein